MAARELVPLGVAAAGDAVGIDPCVQLQAARMGRLHPVCERVKAVCRRGAGRAGQVLTPGEDLGWVQRIRRGADLQKDRVQAPLDTVVQDRVGLGAQRRRVGGRLGGIVQIVNRGHPHAAHLVGRRRRAGRERGDGQGERAHEDECEQSGNSFHNASISFCDAVRPDAGGTLRARPKPLFHPNILAGISQGA